VLIRLVGDLVNVITWVSKKRMSNDDMHNQRTALEWIVGEAERQHLPCQVVGGLACMAHGGTRPLHDIDLYAPFSSLQWPCFLESISNNVVWGPRSVVDGPRDLTYLKIAFRCQRVEIGGSANLRIRDCKTGEWVDQTIDFGSSVSLPVFGREIKVMPRDQLIAYKRTVGRDVDLQDIEQLCFE